MKLDAGHLDHARRVADAVLYEGYLLYPYRRSAQKNQARFQFGVLMPPAYLAVDASEASASQTECVFECPAGAQVWVQARFLHLQRRIVQEVVPGTGELRAVDTLRVGDTEYTSWEEAAEREEQLTARIESLLGSGADMFFRIGRGEENEALAGPDGERSGRLTRRWETIEGAIKIQAERLAGPYGALRLRVRLENRTAPQDGLRSRDDALAHSLIAAHALIGVTDGAFLSMTDPPEWAAPEVAACQNVGTWPVLAGPADCRNLVLSSPVILYDHPETAPESAGDLFDATEIDEILTLRTLALTEEEKQQARSTDPRAADLIDRLDGLPPEMIERLHGAIRYLGPAAPGTPAQAAPAPPGDTQLSAEPGQPGDPARHGAPGAQPGAPWWDPGSDSSVSPETDHVVIGGVPVARGSRVVMRPGSRRADAQDLFLSGREALVEAVLHDVDGQVHVAVSPAADPLAQLQRSHGRFLYFAPDEIEPITAGPPDSGHPPGTADDRASGQKEEQK